MHRILEFAIKHMYLTAALIITLIALAVVELIRQAHSINRLSTLDATRLINSENAVVIDLRQESTFAAGHITAAVNHSYSEINTNIKKIADKYKDQTVILVSESGQKANEIALKLRQDGRCKVHILQGGINAWRQAGLPLIKNA